MTKICIGRIILTLVVLGYSVSAHSWLEFPIPRDWALLGGGREIDNKDIRSACPQTREFGASTTYNSFPMSVVHAGDELCVRHASNGHFNDARRGYSQVSLSWGRNGSLDSYEDFNCNVIANNIDYAAYEGFRVKLPDDLPLGLVTVRWFWHYYGAISNFTSCADILVVDDNLSAYTYGVPPGNKLVDLGHCDPAKDPMPIISGNSAPLLADPVCNGSTVVVNGTGSEDGGGDDIVVSDSDDEDEPVDCQVKLRLKLGNPEFQTVLVDSVEYSTTCDLDDESLHSVEDSMLCDVNITVSLTNYAEGHIVVNDVSEVSNCDEEEGDDSDDGGVSGCGDNDVPPSGYCCVDSDCPRSYCKNYQTVQYNGFWVCQ